jgi:hypothetical protein
MRDLVRPGGIVCVYPDYFEVAAVPLFSHYFLLPCICSLHILYPMTWIHILDGPKAGRQVPLPRAALPCHRTKSASLLYGLLIGQVTTGTYWAG